MGRLSRYKKIKSCDPFYKGPKKDRNSSCNKPLTKNDKLIEQQMPRTAKDLLRRQLAVKNQSTKKKQNGKEKKQATTAKFQRIPGESKKQYFDRIDREAATEIAEYLKGSRKMREGRKRYLKERKRKMKEKKRAFVENFNFDSMKDNVRFGEVAMGPPSLSARPRKASKTSMGSKPLLLHSLFCQEEETNSDINTQRENLTGSALPKTKKRKHMPVAEREKADKERERAIAAYRLMRKKRLLERKEVT